MPIIHGKNEVAIIHLEVQLGAIVWLQISACTACLRVIPGKTSVDIGKLLVGSCVDVNSTFLVEI